MLELTVDKFTFRVPDDRRYSADGVWVQPVPGVVPARVRLGVTDFVQQRGGDVTFVHPQPVGTVLRRGDECAAVETIKVDVSLPSPVAGVVVEVNAALEANPETVNQDPYEAGWLVVVEPCAWDADNAALLDAEHYFAVMRDHAEREAES